MKTLLFFSLLVPTFVTAASTLTLYMTPPDKALDWSSPGSIFTSVMKNKLTFEKRPLGLTVSEISCGNYTEAVSLVPNSLGILGEILIEGRGLGLLYLSFPGELEDTKEELKKNLQNEKTRFVRILINDSHCLRLKDYLKDFREKKVARHFGLPHRPLMGEGGSDTSFGVSLMDVAGVRDQDQRDAWERILYLPKELSGMPLEEKYVNLFSLSGSSWGQNDKDTTVLQFLDPQKISAWIDGSIKQFPAKKMSIQNAIGIQIDKSHLPAPQGTFWKQALDPNYKPKSNSAEK